MFRLYRNFRVVHSIKSALKLFELLDAPTAEGQAVPIVYYGATAPVGRFPTVAKKNA